MDTLVFDGRRFAAEREEKLKQQVAADRLRLRMGSLLFREDPASVTYINLKKQAAVRVGIEFSVEEVSLGDTVPSLQDKIRTFGSQADVTGIMIQKPSKTVWQQYFKNSGERMDYWWGMLTGVLDPAKDVDCLTPMNLDKIYRKQWQLLPATVKAVVSILHKAYLDWQVFSNQHPGFDLAGVKTVVIGRSEIVGRPLATVLAQYGAQVSLYGSDLNQQELSEADLIISATGIPNLITGEMVKDGVVAIDVGSPQADIHFDSVLPKARFITPVPNGVGPVTVVSLLENLVDLKYF